MVSFLKKTRWIVSKIGMQSSFDTASMLLLITFSSYLFEDYFLHFSTFSKCWKKSFFEFPRIGYFLRLRSPEPFWAGSKIMAYISSWFWTTFSVFLKKKPFSHFWLNFLMEKKLKKFRTIKNGFWWLIRAYHSQFSRYRVFKSQNWIKFVVFAIFLVWRFMVKLVYILLCQFLEQLFRSQNCLSASAEILHVAWIYSRNLHVILVMVFLIKFFSIS